MTKLTINGRFLTQSVTGVQRVGLEFIRALDRQIEAGDYPNLDAEVVVPTSAPLVVFPALSHIRLRRGGRFSGHLWEQIDLPILARGRQLLALGNTAPIGNLMIAPRRTHVMVHDLSYRYYPDAYTRSFRLLYNALIPLVLRRAASIFTVSNSERQAILREYPRTPRPARIVAVQNGASFAPLGTLPGRDLRGRRCLYVGSLTKRKNAEGLIKAAVRLVRDHDATFTFIGANGPRFEGVTIDVPEDVAGRIRFAGQLNDPAELAAEYSNAAVFVFPSHYEASPLPPVEAMAHGCPVVASDIPSLRERCENAAAYCDPGNVDSIVSVTSSLLDSEALWVALRDEGLYRSQQFSWGEQASVIMQRIGGSS